MAEPKTKLTDQDPKEFLNTIEPEQKRKDSFTLLDMFEKATGQKAQMWGPAIVGFGRNGDWPLTAFSPRKQSLTLYVLSKNQEIHDLLKKLGKHKATGVCLYINKLADVDEGVLAKIIKKSIAF